MRNSFYLLILCIIISNGSIGQKNTIDKATCDAWISLQEVNGKSCILSHDGKFIVYQYGSNLAGNTVVLKSLHNKFERTFHQASDPVITEDSKRFITMLQGDTLVIYNIIKKDLIYISGVQWYNTPKEGNGQWLAYKKRGSDNILVLKDLFNGTEKTYISADRAIFNAPGTALLIKTEKGLIAVNLLLGTDHIVNNSDNATDFCFDTEGKQVAFVTADSGSNTVKFFSLGTADPAILATNDHSGIERGFEIAANGISFTGDGKRIFFKLKKKEIEREPSANVITKDVNIWTYKDKILQEKQLKQLHETKFKLYTALVNIDSKKIIQIEGDTLQFYFNSGGKDFVLLNTRISDDEYYWNGESWRVYLLSLEDGRRTKLLDSKYPFFSSQELSNDEKFVVWYDATEKNYISYEIATATRRTITDGLGTPLCNSARGEADLIRDRFSAYGIAGWIANDSAILIYDRTDIWLVDPLKKWAPVNITNQFGTKNNITFRFIEHTNGLSSADFKKGVLVTAFNNDSKSNGFYKVRLNRKDPELCVLDNYTYFFLPKSPLVFPNDETSPSKFAPLKARKADVFIVRRMSSLEAPELFSTIDFKNYKILSNIHQERGPVKSRLIKWRLADGQLIDGILHTPYPFDSLKKYPVIFNYYQHRSECLNVFRTPELSGHNVNIPWYVSRGYLIFEPDMYYTTGNVSENIINVVTTAANHLAELSFVDTSKLGAQGQSFGGYETNVIATGTNLFRAACAMAGPTNIVSEYGSLRPGGHNNQKSADIGQRNLATFPWDHPESFITNSPLFQISKAKTPLLLVHNRRDVAILFSQAIELYLGMRRMKHKVWLLEYDDEGHAISRSNNKLDFTIRMQQFFDHYLKGAPAPIWMTNGIPAEDKGIRSGLEFDSSGVIP